MLLLVARWSFIFAPEYFVLIIRYAFFVVKPTLVLVLEILIYWDGFTTFPAFNHHAPSTDIALVVGHTINKPS